MNSNTKFLDQEAIKRTYDLIHYYSCLPKQIKGSSLELNPCEYFLCNDGVNDPAYIVEGVTTIKSGRINTPTICETPQFLQDTAFFF